MAKRLTLYIFIGLVLGLVVGLSLNLSLNDGSAAAAAQLKTIASYFALVTGLFLRLIKMIIAPLVFATLVSGIAQMGDTKALGRIGIRSLAWFISASLVSLSLGMLLVNLLQPGVGLNLPLPAVTADSGVVK
ncbi:MAG TPA: cation:dicarboxylase symporter family transporter, partial [Candidatus Sphingomonas excrementigallinarum]|nr:cation:dicarboxylase symporter family transporter [Candidatus Sphingomonas excrementigallinarum]